jgi:hypothetical protein
VSIFRKTLLHVFALAKDHAAQLTSQRTLKISTLCQAVVAQAFNPSTWEAEAGRFLSSRPTWSTELVPGQPGLHRETLSQKDKKKKKKFPLYWGVLSLWFCLFVCFIFQDRVSLCSPGYPETCFVDQAGLKLTAIHFPSIRIKGMCHHCPAVYVFISSVFHSAAQAFMELTV